VTHKLVPILKAGDVVIMDNLNVHKAAAAKSPIEAVGARVIFLPPY
jgi:transposase